MSFDISKLFVREFERSDDSILNIYQSAVGDVGCVVWDAAIVLASFLETDGFHELCLSLQGKTVVELGAGTGLVGLQAACCGAICDITDLEEFVPLIEHNIAENSSLVAGRAHGKTLCWGTDDLKNFSTKPDFILLADCVYYSESVEPLVTTLNKLSSQATTILCSFEERTDGNKPELQRLFFKLIEQHFCVTEVDLSKQHPHYRSPDIHIMIFTKKVQETE